MLRALRHRPFALLWTGQTISRLGDSLYRIALSWWVLEKTGSAAAMGTVLVVSSIPMVVFLLVGGVVVDRLPRFRVLFTADIVNGLVVAVVTLLAWTEALEVWHVYIAGAVFGLAEAFFFPAYSASIPQVVPPESLPSANSLSSLSWQITGVVGPGLGAALVAVGGTPAAFGLDSLTFLISALCVVPLLGVRLSRPADAVPTTPLADLRDGLATVFARTWLWLSIAFFGFVNLLDAGPRNVALPFLIHDQLGLEVEALGGVTMALSIGSVAAAVVLGRQTRLRRRGVLLYVGEIVMGTMLVVFGLAGNIVGVILAAFIYGIGISTVNLTWTNTLQEMVPQEKLGRVTSVDAVGSFVLLPVGFALAGVLTEAIGAANVFLLGGSIAALLGGLMLLVPSIRRLD